MKTKFTAIMASFTQNEESFTSDSNYFTYTKSTDRISNDNFGHLSELEEIYEHDGVHSYIRADGAQPTIIFGLTH